MAINFNYNINRFNNANATGFSNKKSAPALHLAKSQLTLLKSDTVSFKGTDRPDFNEKEYKANITAIANKLKTAKRVAILTHVAPDGDAISSSAAVLNLMKKLPNIDKATVFISGQTPSDLSFLEETKDFVNINKKNEAEQYLGKFDTVITVDCANKARLANCEKIFDSAETKLKIDHHPPREKYAQIEAVNHYAASATEVLMDLTKELGFNIEKEPQIAKDLFTGLLTDTGGLRHVKDPVNTFMHCAELAKSGVDTEALYKRAVDFIPKSVIPLYKKIVNNLTFSEDGKFIFVKADNKDPDYLADVPAAKNLIKSLTSQFLAVEGVEAGASLTQCKNNDREQTGISLRSNHIDISKIAEANGGGGHEHASGCSMPYSVEKTQDELTKLMSNKLKEYNEANPAK